MIQIETSISNGWFNHQEKRWLWDTPLKFNRLPLKNDGWKNCPILLGWWYPLIRFHKFSHRLASWQVAQPCLFRVWKQDSTTQVYRDYNKPLKGSLWTNQDSMESRSFFFPWLTWHMEWIEQTRLLKGVLGNSWWHPLWVLGKSKKFRVPTSTKANSSGVGGRSLPFGIAYLKGLEEEVVKTMHRISPPVPCTPPVLVEYVSPI